MSDITQGNQFYVKIQESGGKTTISSLAKENIVPITYQVIKGKVYPTAAGSYQVLDQNTDAPIRLYEGQQIVGLAGNGVGLAGGTSLAFGLIPGATGDVGATGIVSGSPTAVSQAIAFASINSNPSLLNISGPIYIDSSLSGSTLVATAAGTFTAGELNVVATVL